MVGLHLLLYFDLASLFARVYESAIGAAAALLAAYFVLPIYATDPVLADTRFVVHLRNAVAELWPDDRPWLVPNSAERLDQTLARVLVGLPAINAEAMLGRRTASELTRLASLLQSMSFDNAMLRGVTGRLARSTTDAELRAQAETGRCRVLAGLDRIRGGEGKAPIRCRPAHCGRSWSSAAISPTAS